MNPSRFLPENFDGRPIALIAGKGRYPELVTEAVRAAGCEVRLIAFDEETETDLWEQFAHGKRERLKVGQLGKLLRHLRSLECGYALMAGQITPRRLFRGLHPDLKALAILNSLKERNAETIFGALAKEIEAIGVHLLDARAFLDDHLATDGVMTRGRKLPESQYLEHGIRIARHVAEADIGQGVVVRKGTVLAVEAFEGTDLMLERAGTFKTDGLIFVKTVKRKQDYRFDVPVFGPRTLRKMKEAGISTAALATNSTLILDKPEVVAEANRLKIEILGYST